MYEGKMPMHKRLAQGEALSGMRKGGKVAAKPAAKTPMKKGSSKGKNC